MVDLSDWSWWWNFNRDPYIDLKRQVLEGEVATGNDEFYLGHGQSSRRSNMAPDRDQKRRTIGPALVRVIDTGSWHLQGDVLLALAKLRPDFDPEGGSTRELMSDYLRDSNQQKSEAAVLALGVLGDPAATELLADLASDSEAGRRHIGRSRVPGHTRPIAAYALGVLGAQLESDHDRLRIVQALQGILLTPRGAAPDLHVACVTALGLVPLGESGPLAAFDGEGLAELITSRSRQVRFAFAMLLDEKNHEAVRAHVPKAIALLARDGSQQLRDETKRALLDELERRGRSDRLVSYGVVEALGMLGDSDEDRIDRDLRKALRVSVAKGNNNQRGLSLVALALVSSRRGQGDEPFAGLAAERQFLLQQVVRGKSRLRPWAALALGLQEYHSLRAGQPASNATVAALIQSNKNVKSPGDSGAWSLALGLCGDERGVEVLEYRLRNTSDEDARGYAALSLGLLGSSAAFPILEEVMLESRNYATLLRKSATALVLLGHKDVVNELLRIVEEEKTATAKSISITVLSLVGDKRVVAPLVEVLEDDEQLDMTRAYAAIALGVACEEDPLPWTAAISNHVNYFAMTETMLAGDGHGVLNLR